MPILQSHAPLRAPTEPRADRQSRARGQGFYRPNPTTAVLRGTSPRLNGTVDVSNSTTSGDNPGIRTVSTPNLRGNVEINNAATNEVKVLGDVSDMTCWFWLNAKGGCKKSDEQCAYAHRDTGKYADPPRKVSPGEPAMAGKNLKRAMQARGMDTRSYSDPTLATMLREGRRHQVENCTAVSAPPTLDPRLNTGLVLNTELGESSNAHLTATPAEFSFGSSSFLSSPPVLNEQNAFTLSPGPFGEASAGGVTSEDSLLQHRLRQATATMEQLRTQNAILRARVRYLEAVNDSWRFEGWPSMLRVSPVVSQFPNAVHDEGVEDVIDENRLPPFVNPWGAIGSERAARAVAARGSF